MKNLFFIVFCLTVVVLQLSTVGVFFHWQRIADIALGLVITFVLSLGFKSSLKWILLIGVFIDAGSSAPFGTVTLAYFLVGWIVSLIAGIADVRSRKVFFLMALSSIVALSEVFKDLLILASLKTRASFLHETFSVPIGFFSTNYLLKIFFTIFATWAVYYVFRKLRRSFFIEPVKLARKY